MLSNSGRAALSVAFSLVTLAAVSTVAASETVGTESKGSPAPPSRLERVIMVFKTHYDLGYTAPLPEIVQTYRTRMIDEALDLCDATRSYPLGQQFAWSIQGWPLARMLDEHQSPQRRERILAALRAERLTCLASPFTLHADAMELEELVRSLRHSSDVAKMAGLPLPRDAKVTDAPSAPWCLPSILSRAGIQFLFVGVNRVCVPPETPLLFWWEGPDGSRLLTMLVDAYGTGQIPPRDIGGFGTGLLPPKDWPHRTWLAMIHTSDNEGPPKQEDVDKLLAQARQELPNTSVRIGRLSDFADAILRENPDLPVVRADMPDTWIHGIMSMPQETKLARNVRPQIATLETLSTLLNAWGVDVADPAGQVAEAYDGSVLFGEHTWGMNVRKFGDRLYGDEWRAAHAAGKYARLEESWAEHGKFIVDTAEIVRTGLQMRMSRLAEAIDAEGRRFVVFNPLPWSRDDFVEVPIGQGPAPAVLRDLATDELVATEVRDGKLTLIARAVPPLGYRTYVPANLDDVPSKNAGGLSIDEASATLENRFLRIQLDPQRGIIRSMVDKTSGRELVHQDGDLGFGQYCYERFSQEDINRYLDAYTRFKSPVAIGDFGKTGLPPASEVPYRISSPRRFELSWSKGPCAATATLHAAADEHVPHAVSLSITLRADQPHADLEWSIENKSPEPWPEAGWLCLPVNAEQPKFRLGRLGAIVDPAREIVPGSNHHVFCINTGLTVTDGSNTGLGICPLDAPLVSLDEPGLWRFSRAYVPKRPQVWVNLYNNGWGTNFAQWIGGSWSSRVRVWSVSGDDADASLATSAWEARLPCLTASTAGPAGTLAPLQAGITLSRPGAIVTAFGTNPDGPGMILRLWEQAGSTGRCSIRLPGEFARRSVQPCDLRGRTVGNAVIMASDPTFDVELPPFAPATVLIDDHP